MFNSIDTPHKERTALIMGGSMAGLWAARVLADHFDQVTIIERDQLPSEPVHRAGVPQARQYHILLRRGRLIMQELFPGLDEELKAAGAIEADLAKDVKILLRGHWLNQNPSGHFVLSCSRVLLETAIRGRLRDHKNIKFVEGAEVIGLCAEKSGLCAEKSGLCAEKSGLCAEKRGSKQVITGVKVRWRQASNEQTDDQIDDQTNKPTLFKADFVVDATGRNSRTPKWLVELGYDVPEKSIVNSFLGYATRRYRKPAEWQADWDMMLISSTPPHQPRSGTIFPEEDNKWVVLLAGANKEYPPTDEEGFAQFARTVAPEFHEAISAAEPITPIYGYRRTENQRYHYEKMADWPERFIVVGDAYCSFNPIYGQGMTVSAMTAVALGEELKKSKGNLDGFASKFKNKIAKVVHPVWLLATSADVQWPETVGMQKQDNIGTRFAQWYFNQLIDALPHDDEIRMTFSDVNQLVKPIFTLFRPNMMARVMRHYLRQKWKS